MRCKRSQTAAWLALCCVLWGAGGGAQARPRRAMPSAAGRVIRYVGGCKPYFLIVPAAALPYAWQDKDALRQAANGDFSRQTPGGRVSVFWRLDAFQEGGTLAVNPSSEYDEPTVMQIAIVSPAAAPIVLEVEEPFDGWLHVDGHVMSYFAARGHKVRPSVWRIPLPRGLNLIEAGVNDAE